MRRMSTKKIRRSSSRYSSRRRILSVMKSRGQRSERARARIEFRHSKQSRVSHSFVHNRGSLSPDGTFEPYSDPFAHFSLFQRRCRRSHYGDSGFGGDDGEVIPVAPPLEILDAVTGYEILSFDSVSVPPPEPFGDFGALDPEQQQMLGTWSPTPSSEYSLRTTTPHVTEPVARTALKGYVKNHCCWGGGAAKNMTVTGIRHNCAYHYVLQTLTEKREARWSWSPHVGGDVDGPENGSAPAPWDIPAFPSKFFRTEMKAIEVPHTASIKPCHRCRGTGTLGCPNCHGKGWTRCLSCQGEGWGIGQESRERCIVCGTSAHGHGRVDCSRCDSKGRVACPVCDSYGQLRCFIQLTVSWKVNVGEHVTGADEMPVDLLRDAEGQIGIEDFGVHLSPLPADVIADETLALASIQLINEHIQSSSDSLLLAQRHQVRVVPVTCIDYKWKSHSGSYYIYGLDGKVFAPDYPQTCCCGCTIL